MSHYCLEVFRNEKSIPGVWASCPDGGERRVHLPSRTLPQYDFTIDVIG